jgi:hypothetical protein
MTSEEAVILYKKIPTFKSEHGRLPELNSRDFTERRMAEALIYLNKLLLKRLMLLWKKMTMNLKNQLI